MVGVQIHTTIWETAWWVFTKAKDKHTLDSEILLPPKTTVHM